MEGGAEGIRWLAGGCTLCSGVKIISKARALAQAYREDDPGLTVKDRLQEEMAPDFPLFWAANQYAGL